MLTRRNIIVVVGLLAALASMLAAPGLGAMKVAQADQWPTRPITMVVPFAAGGPTDVVGRIVADRLGDIPDLFLIGDSGVEPVIDAD